VKINLDSVGEVTVAKSRILDIARTARGLNYAAYILIEPTMSEKMAGITKITVMSNVENRVKNQCKAIHPSGDKAKISCISILRNKSILAIFIIDREGSYDDFHHILSNSIEDLNKILLNKE
jgi:hypothetical protein